MAADRRERDQERPDHDPDRRPAPPDRGDYLLALPGLIACARCAALLLDLEAARDDHDRHHDALRQLWRR